MNDTVKALIYLLSCAVNSVKADETKIRSVNIEELYDICKNLTLRATVYAALKSAGISSETFYLAYNKAVRKNVLLDIERTALLERFEAQGIWYMPLKGSLLKELYPENGMREMADNDILYDAEKQEEVRTIMLSARYTAENIGSDHHDVYMKPPVLNFEMHTKLFEPVHVRMYEYYCDTERLMLIKNMDTTFLTTISTYILLPMNTSTTAAAVRDFVHFSTVTYISAIREILSTGNTFQYNWKS